MLGKGKGRGAGTVQLLYELSAVCQPSNDRGGAVR
jgi:hypothetical protein